MILVSRSLVMCAPLVLSFLHFNGLVWAKGDALDNNSSAPVQRLEIYSDIDAFLRGCMQNYGPEAVRRVKDQWSETGVCLERIFFANHIEEQKDGLVIRIVSANGTTTSSMNDAPITRLCTNHIPDIERCIQSFIVALQGCTAVRGDEDLQSLGNALSAAMNYVCHRDGDRIVNFVAAGGTECLKEPHDTKILDCIRLPRFLFNQLRGRESTNQNDYCRIYEERNECIVRVFEQCAPPSSTVNDIVRGLLNKMMDETKCRNSIHTVNEAGCSAYCDSYFLVVLLGTLLCMRATLHAPSPATDVCSFLFVCLSSFLSHW